MTVPTQLDVVRRLGELSRMLDAATIEVAQLDEDAVKAKARYEVAFARATVSPDNVGPADHRKANATLATANERLDSEIAAAKLRACQERIRTLRVQIDVGRSLGAAQRAEWAASGLGQP